MSTRRLGEVLRFVAANVRAMRLRRGLTQEVLAEVAEVDLRFLQKIETGRTNLSLDVLVRLADALSIKPGLLLRAARLPLPRPGRPPKPKGKVP
jgi:transcriptional regulator with XRE-family HTH domain